MCPGISWESEGAFADVNLCEARAAKFFDVKIERSSGFTLFGTPAIL